MPSLLVLVTLCAHLLYIGIEWYVGLDELMTLLRLRCTDSCDSAPVLSSSPALSILDQNWT